MSTALAEPQNVHVMAIANPFAMARVQHKFPEGTTVLEMLS
jgi:hypothetical protein